MRYCRTVNYTDSTYDDLLHRKQVAVDNLRDYQHRLESLEARLPTLQTARNILFDLIHPVEQMIPDVMAPCNDAELNYEVRRRLSNTVVPLDHQIYETKNKIARYPESIANQQQEIATVNEKLSRYPERYTGRRTLTKESVVEAFKHVDHVRSDSIALGYIGTDTPILRWEVGPVLATPTRIPDWVNYGEPVQICIEPTIITLELKSKRIQVTTENPKHCFYSYSGPAPHPHILGSSPCLGDFGGPITEAIHEHDWETVATLMVLFLQTIVSEDSAGQNWIYGIRTYSGETLHRKRRNDDMILPDPEHPGFFILHRPDSASEEVVIISQDEYGLAA